MQTFLPFPSFVRSARVLDARRLGKQRIEAWQILRALTGESRGWRNHPAVRMWRGHEGALTYYGRAMCCEWIARGYKDTMMPRFLAAGKSLPDTSFALPRWVGDSAFHAAHRAVLLAKDYGYYCTYGWAETPAVRDTRGRWPYVWPEVAA